MQQVAGAPVPTASAPSMSHQGSSSVLFGDQLYPESSLYSAPRVDPFARRREFRGPRLLDHVIDWSDSSSSNDDCGRGSGSDGAAGERRARGKQRSRLRRRRGKRSRGGAEASRSGTGKDSYARERKHGMPKRMAPGTRSLVQRESLHGVLPRTASQVQQQRQLRYRQMATAGVIAHSRLGKTSSSPDVRVGRSKRPMMRATLARADSARQPQRLLDQRSSASSSRQQLVLRAESVESEVWRVLSVPGSCGDDKALLAGPRCHGKDEGNAACCADGDNGNPDDLGDSFTCQEDGRVSRMSARDASHAGRRSPVVFGVSPRPDLDFPSPRPQQTLQLMQQHDLQFFRQPGPRTAQHQQGRSGARPRTKGDGNGDCFSVSRRSAGRASAAEADGHAWSSAAEAGEYAATADVSPPQRQVSSSCLDGMFTCESLLQVANTQLRASEPTARGRAPAEAIELALISVAGGAAGTAVDSFSTRQAGKRDPSGHLRQLPVSTPDAAGGRGSLPDLVAELYTPPRRRDPMPSPQQREPAALPRRLEQLLLHRTKFPSDAVSSVGTGLGQLIRNWPEPGSSASSTSLTSNIADLTEMIHGPVQVPPEMQKELRRQRRKRRRQRRQRRRQLQGLSLELLQVDTTAPEFQQILDSSHSSATDASGSGDDSSSTGTSASCTSICSGSRVEQKVLAKDDTSCNGGFERHECRRLLSEQQHRVDRTTQYRVIPDGASACAPGYSSSVVASPVPLGMECSFPATSAAGIQLAQDTATDGGSRGGDVRASTGRQADPGRMVIPHNWQIPLPGQECRTTTQPRPRRSRALAQASPAHQPARVLRRNRGLSLRGFSLLPNYDQLYSDLHGYRSGGTSHGRSSARRTSTSRGYSSAPESGQGRRSKTPRRQSRRRRGLRQKTQSRATGDARYHWSMLSMLSLDNVDPRAGGGGGTAAAASDTDQIIAGDGDERVHAGKTKTTGTASRSACPAVTCGDSTGDESPPRRESADLLPCSDMDGRDSAHTPEAWESGFSSCPEAAGADLQRWVQQYQRPVSPAALLKLPESTDRQNVRDAVQQRPLLPSPTTVCDIGDQYRISARAGPCRRVSGSTQSRTPRKAACRMRVLGKVLVRHASELDHDILRATERFRRTSVAMQAPRTSSGQIVQQATPYLGAKLAQSRAFVSPQRQQRRARVYHTSNDESMEQWGMVQAAGFRIGGCPRQ